MKILATRIAKELKTAKHCAVYEPELTRVWPDAEKRQSQIASFAQRHGWRLRHYSPGFCAIFDNEPSRGKLTDHENSRWANQTRIATAGE